MDPRAAFRDEVTAALEAALRAVGHDGEAPALEVPPDPAMGDLGMPCFPLAKTLRRAPHQIAADLHAALDLSGAAWTRDARPVGPYVNFTLDHAALARHILQDPDAALAPPTRPGKVLIEHTSANPNGPLHVGRARNPILGDTLVRLWRAAGHDVASQYYMDNLGRQVALLYWGRTHLKEDDLEPAGRDKPDHVLVRYYQAANERMKADEAVAAEVRDLVARLEAADEALLRDVRPVYEECFSGMQESLQRLGVAFDAVKDESDLVLSGAVEEVVETLKGTQRAGVEEDGANYLDMADILEGSKNTRFYFTRKDGTSVYATRDVAYHAWKAQQVGAGGTMVDILGEDHKLQAKQVGVALEALGVARPTVVFYAFVSLPEGKMSTRAGRVVFLDDLLDEAVTRALAAVRERRGDELGEEEMGAIAESVGIAAIRYNIARVQPEKQIKFRWEEALDFDGDSAPYLMYAHARAASLLGRAAAAGITSEGFDAARAGDGEARLLSAVSRFSTEAEEAATRFAPHRFCAYAMDLARAWNDYYRDHPVVACENEALRRVRMRTVEVTKAALVRCHEALGLPLLERM